MTAPTPSIDYAALKSGGIIMQKDDDFFALRLRLPGGCIACRPASQDCRRWRRSTVGAKFVSPPGRGSRFPGSGSQRSKPPERSWPSAGLALGPCGPRFRTVTACPGLPVCRRALADSQSFARQIDRKFGGLQLPHKFKATVSACPNACSRPLENEIGFCGSAEPELQKDACMGCGLCVDICREKALVLQDGKPLLDRSRCVLCADCMQSCPTDAWKTKRMGYAVYAGGKNGRHPTLGEKIADFVDEEQGMMIIQRCLDFYLQHGNKRERLGDLIRRVGMDEFKAAVLQ